MADKCAVCGGKGTIYVPMGRVFEGVCPTCHGTGETPKEAMVVGCPSPMYDGDVDMPKCSFCDCPNWSKHERPEAMTTGHCLLDRSILCGPEVRARIAEASRTIAKQRAAFTWWVNLDVEHRVLPPTVNDGEWYAEVRVAANSPFDEFDSAFGATMVDAIVELHRLVVANG